MFFFIFSMYRTEARFCFRFKFSKALLCCFSLYVWRAENGCHMLHMTHCSFSCVTDTHGQTKKWQSFQDFQTLIFNHPKLFWTINYGSMSLFLKLLLLFIPFQSIDHMTLICLVSPLIRVTGISKWKWKASCFLPCLHKPYTGQHFLLQKNCALCWSSIDLYPDMSLQYDRNKICFYW